MQSYGRSEEQRGGRFGSCVIMAVAILLPAGGWANPWLSHLWTPTPILDTAVSSLSGGLGFALDSNDSPAVTYQGKTDPGPGGLWYATLLGDSFVSEAVEATYNAGQASALRFAGTTPHVSYRGYDGSAFNVGYATYASGGWTTSTVHEASPSNARHSDIIIDSNGTVAIAWLDRRDPLDFFDDTVDFAYRSGDGWVNERVADFPWSAGTVSLGTTGSVADAQVAWVNDDWPNFLPLISHRTGDDTWTVEKIQTSADVCYIDMAFDANGDPVVAYLDASTRNVVFAYKSGGTWQTEIVYDGEEHPAYEDQRLLSLTVDQWGTPHLLFHDAAANDLLYTNRAYGAWQEPRTIAQDTPARWLHITTDSAGRPHFAYHQDPVSGDGRMYYGVGTAVPEPGTWALIIVGCAALALLRRHRRREGPVEQ